jgi:hypothetical protein
MKLSCNIEKIYETRKSIDLGYKIRIKKLLNLSQLAVLVKGIEFIYLLAAIINVPR